MDAVEFLKQYSRMVTFGVQPFKVPSNLPYEEIVSRVEQWAKEHPVKTRQSELLKLFPEVISDPDGFIDICPALIVSAKRETKTGGCRYPSIGCEECKREFWLAEIKDGEA